MSLSKKILVLFALLVCGALCAGVESDPKETVKRYRKAAEQGDAKVQYNLGVRYQNGIGVEKDPQEAEKCWRVF